MRLALIPVLGCGQRKPREPAQVRGPLRRCLSTSVQPTPASDHTAAGAFSPGGDGCTDVNAEHKGRR